MIQFDMERTEKLDAEVIYNRKANLSQKEKEPTQSAIEMTLYEAGIKAILSVLQNHVETALKTSEMSDRVGGRTEPYKRFKERIKEKSGRAIDLILSGSISQRLVAFHWVYPSVDSGLFGRKAVPDIDVLIVDKSYTVSEEENFKHGLCLLMKPTSNPGYVRLFKGSTVRSRCISSKGFRKYWRGLVDQVELFTRYTGRGNRFPGRGKDVTGILTLLSDVSRSVSMNNPTQLHHSLCSPVSDEDTWI